MTENNRQTKFRYDWLQQTDSNGTLINTWCKRGDTETEAECFVCKTSIDVSQGGISRLISHSRAEKHKRLVREVSKCQPVTSFFAATPSRNFTKHQKDVLQSELIWAARQVDRDFSFASSSDSAGAFRRMFPDSSIAKDFSCGRTKATYLTTEALEPEFTAMLTERLAKCPFSILLDEKTSGNRSFVAFLVRYLDQDQREVVTTCLSVNELSGQTAEVLKKLLQEVLVARGVPFKNLLAIMCDSCNTMRGEKGGVIAKLRKEPDLQHVLDLGGCSLHHVHNATKYAVIALGDEVEQFAKDVFNYFRYAKRRLNLEAIQQELQIPELSLLRPVETRWLQMHPVVSRLLVVWPALERFSQAPDDSNEDMENKLRLKRIKLATANKATLLKLQFLHDALQQCKKFELLFQKKEPLIHVLFQKMDDLLKSVLVRFVSKEAMEGQAVHQIDFKNPVNHLPAKQIIVGELCQETLRSSIFNLESGASLMFLKEAKDFYVVLVDKLALFAGWKS